MSAELAVEMADAYLNTHRVSETWRLIDMLRDELVRATGTPTCKGPHCKATVLHNVDTCPIYSEVPDSF